jgi:hypothetical protein
MINYKVMDEIIISMLYQTMQIDEIINMYWASGEINYEVKNFNINRGR